MSLAHPSNTVLRFWENVKHMFLLSSVTPDVPEQNKPKPSEQEKKKQEEQQQQQILPL